MGQQPNVELTEEERPRPIPQPGPPPRWRPIKPGLPLAPGEVPSGGRFGTTGPDPGWALRLLTRAELPDQDPKLEAVLTGLMLARAAALGRAPVKGDLEVALLLCGYGDEPGPELIKRREKWKAAVPHEIRPGETAVAEVDRELMVKKPEQVRYALRRMGKP